MTRRLALALVLGCAAALNACAARAPAAPPAAAGSSARALPPDSAALLERALRAARPAYETQDQALRSGVYAGRSEPGVAPPAPLAAAPPPPSTPPVGGSVATERSPMAIAADAAAAARAAGQPLEREAPEATLPAVPAAPPPAAAEPPPPPPDRTPPAGDYVVQIAAFRDEASARTALELARREHPGLHVEVEAGEGVYRVVLGAWPDLLAAQARLPELRTLYPSAWARRRALP